LHQRKSKVRNIGVPFKSLLNLTSMALIDTINRFAHPRCGQSPCQEVKQMKITFSIPERIHGHEVGNALILGAEKSHLCEGNEMLEIEGGVGVKVLCILC